jgi:hypothetical protein
MVEEVIGMVGIADALARLKRREVTGKIVAQFA